MTANGRSPACGRSPSAVEWKTTTSRIDAATISSCRCTSWSASGMVTRTPEMVTISRSTITCPGSHLVRFRRLGIRPLPVGVQCTLIIVCAYGVRCQVMPRPRSFTHSRIATAALAVVDRDGLGALSMRTVAGELGMGTMSLYRYVQDREELERLVVDVVIGTVDAGPPARESWR